MIARLKTPREVQRRQSPIGVGQKRFLHLALLRKVLKIFSLAAFNRGVGSLQFSVALFQRDCKARTSATESFSANCVRILRSQHHQIQRLGHVIIGPHAQAPGRCPRCCPWLVTMITGSLAGGCDSRPLFSTSQPFTSGIMMSKRTRSHASSDNTFKAPSIHLRSKRVMYLRHDHRRRPERCPPTRPAKY